MFMPSARNYEEMKYEPAGCWPLPINDGNEYALITKMPASVIKAAYRSCPVSLTVARADTPEGVVLATTLKIEDDPGAALMLSGVLRHEEEQSAIENILRAGRTLMIFFDELSRPVARAECLFNSTECVNGFDMVAAPGRRYAGPWTPLLSDVLDEIQGHGDPQLAVATKHAPAFVVIPQTLTGFETLKMTTIGIDDVIEFRLDDPDEGHGLEQSTWHLLENLFAGQLFHSPQVREGGELREFTDILAACGAGVCLIEAKTAAALSTKPDRTTERRAKSVQKQIDKGIDQLIGSLRNLATGLPLLTKKELPLTLPSTTGPYLHGIVMVSEMLPSLDWKAVATQLIAASQKSGAMFHVVDLQELRILVGISRDQPDLLVAYLAHRFGVMKEREYALLRTRLSGPHIP